MENILNGKVKELSGYDIVGSEKTIGNSRIDIYLANLDDDNNPVDEAYVEVKSVTLIKDGIGLFHLKKKGFVQLYFS